MSALASIFSPGVIVGVVVALGVFAWQKHDAAKLNRKVDYLRAHLIDDARRRSPEEIA